MLLKIITMIVIFGIIYYGVGKIRRNINDYFSGADADKLRRDREDLKRSDVVDLEQDEDGVFRPGGKIDDKKDRK